MHLGSARVFLCFASHHLRMELLLVLEHSVVYHVDLTPPPRKTHQTLCAQCRRKCWCFLYVFYTPDSRFKRHRRLLRCILAISVLTERPRLHMDMGALGYNGFSSFCLHRSFPPDANLPIPVGLFFAILAVCVSGIIFMDAFKVWCKRKKVQHKRLSAACGHFCGRSASSGYT